MDEPRDHAADSEVLELKCGERAPPPAQVEEAIGLADLQQLQHLAQKFEILPREGTLRHLIRPPRAETLELTRHDRHPLEAVASDVGCPSWRVNSKRDGTR